MRCALVLVGLFGCGDQATSTADASDAASAPTIPVVVAPYAGAGNGSYLRVSITVGGAPVDVLLDTGSSGLRVFASAIPGAAMTITAEADSVEFGGGDRMVGHTATAIVGFSELATSAPIAFHLVESFACDPAVPACDFAGNNAASFTDSGIYGILGVGLRAGDPAEVFSPFAQLADGFVIHTGGFGSTAGEVTLGAATGFATIALPPAGTLPDGKPAWADDSSQACFTVDGVATQPACTDVVFDTGSNADVIDAMNLSTAQLTNGALAPNVAFAVTSPPAAALAFTVGAQTTSRDLVLIDTSDAFAILGIEVFFRDEISFDLASGQVGLRPY